MNQLLVAGSRHGWPSTQEAVDHLSQPRSPGGQDRSRRDLAAPTQGLNLVCILYSHVSVFLLYSVSSTSSSSKSEEKNRSFVSGLDKLEILWDHKLAETTNSADCIR